MIDQRGFQRYKERSLETMSQEELLLLLLDELVKRLLRGEFALSEGDYSLFDVSIQRCIDIVRYLDDTLDRKYEISRQLHRLYDFFCYDLNRVKLGRNKEELSRLKPMITDLRDAFRTASEINAGKAEPPSQTQNTGGSYAGR